MAYTPPYPKPLDKSSKRSLWAFMKRSKKSWLATLYEGSYEGRISCIKRLNVQIFFVKAPELIKEMLVEKFSSYSKHEVTENALKPLLGESVFTTNGPKWERQRRMLDPAFGQAKLKEVFSLMRGGSDAMVERFDQLEDGDVKNIEIEMTHVTADIIMRTILSEPLEGDDALRIFNAFHKFQDKSALMIKLGFVGIPLWLAPWSYLIWKRKGKEIRQLFAMIIRKRYEAYRRGEPSHHKDILQSLLETTDPEDGSKFSLEELVDQVAVLFLAGHETSASALSWSLFLLAKCPEIQESLHQETVTLLGERHPEFKDIPRHRKIRNVFRETMRVYPPLSFLIYRKAIGNQRMDGRDIPDGAGLLISPWLVHRHRKLWDRPDEFDPDRFEGGLNQPSCAYIPFGQGPRICIGAAFAMQEAMLILATLTRRYRFEPGPGPDPEPTSRLTVRSLNGILLRVWKRPKSEEPGTPHSEENSIGSEEQPKCPFH